MLLWIWWLRNSQGELVNSSTWCYNSLFTCLYKQRLCKLLAFSSLTVVPVYFLSTGSFRKRGYFSHLFPLLLKCLVHICRGKERLAFASHAQWEAWRVWVGLERCCHLHGISRGSVCQERCEHQTTTGNGTQSSLQLCGVQPRKLPLDRVWFQSHLFSTWAPVSLEYCIGEIEMDNGPFSGLLQCQL